MSPSTQVFLSAILRLLVFDPRSSAGGITAEQSADRHPMPAPVGGNGKAENLTAIMAGHLCISPHTSALLTCRVEIPRRKHESPRTSDRRQRTTSLVAYWSFLRMNEKGRQLEKNLRERQTLLPLILRPCSLGCRRGLER